MVEIISVYIICYAIGYMLFVRPFFQKRGLNEIIDKIFYGSLFVLATLKYFS